MNDDDAAIRRQASRRYWAALIAWYSAAAVLATLTGRFAHSPWPVCAILFGGLEVVTFLASMYEDDWGNDFRGDREILVRGTLANAGAVVIFTAIGIALPGGRL